MQPLIICLTPVKNEAWILDHFLHATSLWADYIIIADQMSTDGSREIALRYSKVILIDNIAEEFNEPERQSLLINEARKISGSKLLITLDADEIFTPNCMNTLDWSLMLNSSPGTVFNFQWVNLCSGLEKYWDSCFFSGAFMDDGYKHDNNKKIHSTRIPYPEYSPSVNIINFRVMHFQYINWDRMQSKHRWYQCFEMITFPNKSPLDIFRTYHHMYTLKKENFHDIPSAWINEYLKLGINLIQIPDDEKYWWDEKVLDYFDQLGTSYFRKLAIWDVDWSLIAQRWNHKPISYQDPRFSTDKMIHYFLMKTQKHQQKFIVRKISTLFKKIFSY